MNISESEHSGSDEQLETSTENTCLQPDILYESDSHHSMSSQGSFCDEINLQSTDGETVSDNSDLQLDADE